MRRSVLLLLALVVSACTTSPIPDGYTGPLAKIIDTSARRSDRAEDFFVLDQINGKLVDNALRATTTHNEGRGFSMDVLGYARDVPATSAVFSIRARTHYAAPILELTNTVYQVKGDITFAPAPNRRYVVRGTLTPDYSAVWLEDAETKALIGQKIEIKGDASLGALEK